MSSILCPECGTKISDKATTCPHCGFIGNESLLPISIQATHEPIPFFQYDIEGWNPAHHMSVLSVEDNKILFRHFGNWESIQAVAPGVAKVIEDLAGKETIYVAKMDSFVKRLIDEGILRFTKSNTGEILPTIRDAKGFVHQVRLEKVELRPDLLQSLSHLQTQALVAQILAEIEYVGDAIRQIHVELQEDRLAMVDSTRDKLLHAQRIQDTRLRQVALLNAISSATDAKRILMRNFTNNLRYIADHSQKNTVEMLLDIKGQRDIDPKAADAFQALVSITDAVQIESEGFAILGEYEAAKECLYQFRDFIQMNKLGERDTLLELNSNVKQKQLQVVDEFIQIADRITNLTEIKLIDQQVSGTISLDKDVANEKKVQEG